MLGPESDINRRPVGPERSGANQRSAGAYRRIGQRSLLPDSHDDGRRRVFRPLPRDAVAAFTGLAATTPRYVILLPTGTTNLWKTMNLAVVLGRSLRHVPDLRPRDELVLDVEANTYHHAFCDLTSPCDLACARPCGHDGPCQPF
nr:hypothetical protein [Micromonospora sp. DSM 115978]